MALFPFFGRSSGNSSIWDPFSSNQGIFDPFEGVSSAFNHPFLRGSSYNVDWVETPTEHVFKADLPGMTKQDIKVEVLDERTLSISGERKKEVVEERDSWRCVERSQGKFRRQFGLPENANVDSVAAKVENGVLTVTIPKVQAAGNPQVRSINIA